MAPNSSSPQRKLIGLLLCIKSVGSISSKTQLSSFKQQKHLWLKSLWKFKAEFLYELQFMHFRWFRRKSLFWLEDFVLVIVFMCLNWVFIHYLHDIVGSMVNTWCLVRSLTGTMWSRKWKVKEQKAGTQRQRWSLKTAESWNSCRPEAFSTFWLSVTVA